MERTNKAKVLFLFVALSLHLSFAPSSGRTEDVFRPMQEEIGRAMKELRFEDYPPPYFIGLRIARGKRMQTDFREGVIENALEEKWNTFFPEVRVGNYSFDSTPDAWNPLESDRPIVLDGDPKRTRHYIWSALDNAYKEAVGQYLSKKAKRSAEGAPEYATEDWTVEPPASLEEEKTFKEPPEKYAEILSRVSKDMGGSPEILLSLAQWQREQSEIFFASSEGSRIYTRRNPSRIYLSLFGRSLKGFPLHVTQTFHAVRASDIPGEEKLQEAVRSMKQLYFELYRSSEAQGALAPCILDAQSAGQLFAEFAQRLEGERQRDPNEPQTFRDKLNQAILPSFLTLTDDPALAEFKGTALLGHYALDEEGVPPKKVILVEKGILKGFLLSRRPIKGFTPGSNGHGRADLAYPAHARIGNLMVRSDRSHSWARLRSMLLAEVQRRKAPFGVIVEGLEMIGQDQTTGAHQTFRGAPQKMTLVYPDGREVLAHQGEVVGTPIKLMQAIVATGDEQEAQNLMSRGASGSIPASVISPAILVSEIEVQKGSSRPMRLPILPSPLAP